jgi:hypothetical protein
VSLLLISSVTVIAETFCATISNVTLHDPSGPQPQTGDVHLLGVGSKQVWPRLPRTKNGRRTIRYCYVDEAARTSLQCSHMRLAVTACAEAIDSIANAENGHSVAWKEIMFKHESCRWQPRSISNKVATSGTTGSLKMCPPYILSKARHHKQP